MQHSSASRPFRWRSIRTRLSGSLTGNGRSAKPLRTEKVAVLIPMPKASTDSAIIVNNFLLRRDRTAYRRSCQTDSKNAIPCTPPTLLTTTLLTQLTVSTNTAGVISDHLNKLRDGRSARRSCGVRLGYNTRRSPCQRDHGHKRSHLLQKSASLFRSPPAQI